MGTASLFALNPNALLSAFGLWRGPDATVPTPAERWQDAVVDVVIHANCQQHNIVYCLASLLRQSLRPRQIILADDDGFERDHTVQIAREFANANGMTLRVVERTWSTGKTPTVKWQSRELDGDVAFVLDADTLLESPTYLERCVRELYQGVGIASACGVVLPMRARDRRLWAAMPEFRRWVRDDEYRDPLLRRDSLHRFLWWLGNSYRESVCAFQQGFINRGQMALLGGIVHPQGGAVAYRRRYLKDVFDRYEPVYGDDLTAAPDLFIGFALGNVGYRNIQLHDVQARSVGPEIQQVPHLAQRSTIAFLQSCRDFDSLLSTPLKSPQRWWRQWRERGRIQATDGRDLRKVHEAYRQPFGERLTRQQGRPIGWAVFFAAVEKIVFPLLLMALAATAQWIALLLLVAVECVLTLGLLLAVTPGAHLPTLVRGLLATPVRYGLMFVDLFTVVRFMVRRPVRGERKRGRRS
ncbi:MAG: glycosyltransferase [Pseudomonadota bacterium]|nr:glycosyltransferase [Pseudomonadota bacterium]